MKARKTNQMDVKTITSAIQFRQGAKKQENIGSF